MTPEQRTRQSQQQKARRVQYKAAGQCSMCGHKRDRPGRLTCTKCSNVDTRAAELKSQGQVAYWVVLSYQDGLALLAGSVPATVRAHVQRLLKREPTEGAAEYAARVAEATA